MNVAISSVQFSSVAQSCPTLCNPMNRSMPGLLSITNSWSSLRLTSIESVMPSSHLILCRSLLLLPPIPPSIRVLSNESTLCMRWPKYWSFSFSIISSKDVLLHIPTDSKVKISKPSKCRQSNSLSLNCVYIHTHSTFPQINDNTKWSNFLQFSANNYMLKHCTQQNDEIHQYFSVLLGFFMVSKSLASPCLD